uniref:Flagellar biosynthesis, cell-distal portion of basal-body rod n=1 Tax=Klebsiella pneumoniae TaxID=573 RepID=A0A486VAX8_KLEPN|nr:flagellar biosynthesis, cell-distal portion of basal-body rod [Klebsiella pneumoniae]
MAELNPPLGTTTPEIFMDNVKRADELVNGPAGTVNDRGGEPLDTWRQMMAKNDEIRQNIIPLSKQYATLAAAQADIANIPEGSTAYYRSPDDSALAIEVMNVGGMLTATGRKMPSQEYVEGISTGLGFPDSGLINAGSGNVWLMRDESGLLRVFMASKSDGYPVIYADVPLAIKNEAFGVSELIEINGRADPYRVTAYRDEDGNLRIVQYAKFNQYWSLGSDSESESRNPTEYVVFLVAGQSNAQGMGSAAKSPSVNQGVAYQYYNGALTPVLGDSVGNASTGSAWPAFANEFYRRTGLGVVFIPSAVGSSGLTAIASLPANGGNGQNWSGTGTLRGTAIARYNDAIAALESGGFAYRFGGVLWSQGERDARCLPSASNKITEQDYKNEFANLKSYFSETFGDKFVWIISQTGGDDAGIDAQGLTDMRRLQREIVRSTPGVYFGWNGAYNLIARGLMRSHDFPNDPDNVNRSHYSQQGYNEMGTAMAVVAASIATGNS